MGMIKRSGENRKIATTKGDENETRLSNSSLHEHFRIVL